MTAPDLAALRTAYEAWLTAPTRTCRFRAREPRPDGPSELDIYAFEEGDGDEALALIATAGMSGFEIAAPSRRVELVLPIASKLEDAQFDALAKWLGELAAIPFRDRSCFAPNVIVGPVQPPMFEGKRFVLLADYNIRTADYLPIDPEIRLLRVTPLTEAEAAIAREIGDTDLYHRLQLEQLDHQDPRRPEAKLTDPVAASTEAVPGGESIDELWVAIEAWLGTHAAPTRDALRPGASDAAIDELERVLGRSLPEAHRASLRRHDGGAYLTDYEYLSTAQIASIWTAKRDAAASGSFVGREVADKGGGVIRNFWWHPGWVPFAADGGGNLLCIDLVPGWAGARGQVIHWERASGPYGSDSPSFHRWLKTYRDDLLAGQRYEVDAEGFINIKP